MKVEFSLTFQEYVDAHKNHLRRPDRSAAYSLGLVGLLVTGMGWLVLWAGPTGSRTDGMGFLVVGLLLLSGAPVAWVTAKHRTQKADVKKLRESYERFGADMREFEATDRGWRYKSRYGDTSHNWTAFRWLEEAGAVLKLTAPPNIYTIPKRLLGDEGLLLLRQFIDKALPAELAAERFLVEYRVSARDYVAARVRDGWHRQRLTFILAYVFVVLCFLFYLYRAIASEEIGRSLNAVMAGIILVGIIVVERAYYWAQYASLRDYYAREMRMSVREGGVIVNSPTTLEVQRFSLFLKAIESRTSFLLYIAYANFYIIPKRAFTGAQLDDFRQLLAKQVPVR